MRANTKGASTPGSSTGPGGSWIRAAPSPLLALSMRERAGVRVNTYSCQPSGARDSLCRPAKSRLTLTSRMLDQLGTRWRAVPLLLGQVEAD